MAGDTFVIVAARDESDSIAATLAALSRAFPQAAILVADDASTDATPSLAQQAGATVVRGERPLGKGAAATAAASRALEAAATARSPEEALFVLCDGDLGESAGALVALADVVRRGDADVAVAAFARRAGGGFGLALACARLAIRRRCGLRAQAPLSGQRALSARALTDALPFAGGFGMEVGMTIDVVRAGHRLVEIELDLDHRASGRTPAGFLHRARQLLDVLHAYRARG